MQLCWGSQKTLDEQSIGGTLHKCKLGMILCSHTLMIPQQRAGWHCCVARPHAMLAAGSQCTHAFLPKQHYYFERRIHCSGDRVSTVQPLHKVCS